MLSVLQQTHQLSLIALATKAEGLMDSGCSLEGLAMLRAALATASQDATGIVDAAVMMVSRLFTFVHHSSSEPEPFRFGVQTLMPTS